MNRDACAQVALLELCHGLGHRSWPSFAFSVSLAVYNKVLKAYSTIGALTDQEIEEAASDGSSTEAMEKSGDLVGMSPEEASTTSVFFVT